MLQEGNEEPHNGTASIWNSHTSIRPTYLTVDVCHCRSAVCSTCSHVSSCSLFQVFVMTVVPNSVFKIISSIFLKLYLFYFILFSFYSFWTLPYTPLACFQIHVPFSFYIINKYTYIYIIYYYIFIIYIYITYKYILYI